MRDDYSSVLWDYKKETIATLPQDFLVKRALTYGTVGLILKTIREFGIEYVRDTFNSLRPTALSEKKYYYLKNYLLR